ncbi:MAG: hypothetical protein HRT45_13895 [Bdellovibrionales bacterium]|nr:hypothetical protein [Bdellovibrionales bacterium]
MTSKTIQAIAIVVVSMGLVACGQGMTSKGLTAASKAGGTNNGQGADNNNDSAAYAPVPFDVQKVSAEVQADSDDAVEQANVAAEEAERYLNKIKLGGGRIEIQGEGGASRQLIIDKAIAKVLDKIYEKLQQSPQVFDTLRGKLADKISQLDTANPLHQSAIAALMTVMSRIDGLEARYKQLLGRLAGGMDVVINRLEVLVGAVPFPASLLVAIEWADVKRVLQDFQNKLQNL